MASPISVSYLVIIIYLTVVIGGTLLVGLLPPLVNRPYCDDDAVLRVAVDPVFEDKIEAFIEPIVDVALDREKREVVEDRSWLLDELEERKRLADEHIQNRLQTSPIFARLKPLKAIENITTCSELTSPIAGVQYPWYDPRLPKEITPENYNIQILLDNLGGQLYDGFIDIKFNAKNDTNYLLLHIGKKDYPEIEFFRDKDGNDVEIACQGFFPYVRNDYYILKTVQPLNAAQSPYTVEILFVDYYTGVDNGVFKINYGETANNSTMFVSKFRPIDARRAFPLFDEPGIKATYDITIYHRPDFVAVSNTPVKSSGPDEIVPQIYTTVFETTPPMPTYYIALSAFNPNDFGFVTMNTTRSNIPVSLWARKQYIDGGFGQDPLEMSVKIFDALDDIFRGVGAKALPPKIDILVVPEYPVSGIGHFGLPIVEEDKILFKTGSATERDKQETALLIAQMFAEFWFGNFITQGWWDELWTQEGFVDYIKFRAVDTALGEWNILSQFIPTELVETLILDGYPSSHPVQKPISSPYEIEEYFDLIETAKTAAILRMLENEFDYADMLQAIDNYLNANPWGTADIQVFYNNFTTFGNGWTVKDFFERWTKQANFPLLNVEIDDSQLPQQSVVFTQTRAMNSNSSIFSGDLLYPSPWNFIWYIPIQCAFGNGTDAGSYVREFEYYLDTRTATFTLPAGVRWTWVHCDRKFVGYFELVYTLENWIELGVALEQKNTEFVSEDRAQIIHNLFMNAYAERGDYYTIRSILEGYLSTETEYLPWRTVLIHAQRLSAVLAYRKTFYEFSEFFAYQVRQLEATIDIWSNEDGSHIDELLKETLIDLACDMQDSTCLQSASSRWPQALQILEHADFVNASIASYARQFVYDYHIENTYDVEDWDIIFREYAFIIDVNEQRKLINSLTYSRLPWLLIDVLKGIGENFVLRLDFFKVASVLKYNPLGREILWDEFRKEYENLVVQYGEDDPRLGWILVEITESFETEFLFQELLDFFTKATTGATANARFKSLEIVSTNIKWLDSNENEIRCAFRLMGPGADCATNKVHPLLDFLNQPRSSYTRVREMFFNFLKNTNLPIFQDLKNRLL